MKDREIHEFQHLLYQISDLHVKEKPGPGYAPSMLRWNRNASRTSVSRQPHSSKRANRLGNFSDPGYRWMENVRRRHKTGWNS